MADTQATTGATVITNSYAPNNGIFNCFDDMNSCLLGLVCEPINLGMLAEKTKTGDMISVCCTWSLLYWLGGCHLCYAPGVINSAVAKYGVTEEPVSCPTYCLCGACLTCRAHREVDARIKMGVIPTAPQIAVVMAAPTPVTAIK